MNGVSFGQDSYTDLDFASDVSLMAELLELLIPVLETMASEATSLGFEVNWQKTKVQAVGTRVNVLPTIKVQGQQVAVVDQLHQSWHVGLMLCIQWCLRTLLGITWHQFVRNDSNEEGEDDNQAT